MRASNSGTSPPRSSPGRIAPALTIVPSPARMRSSASRKATARSRLDDGLGREQDAARVQRLERVEDRRLARPGGAPRRDGIVHHEGLRERALCRGERLLGARQESGGVDGVVGRGRAADAQRERERAARRRERRLGDHLPQARRGDLGLVRRAGAKRERKARAGIAHEPVAAPHDAADARRNLRCDRLAGLEAELVLEALVEARTRIVSGRRERPASATSARIRRRNSVRSRADAPASSTAAGAVRSIRSTPWARAGRPSGPAYQRPVSSIVEARPPLWRRT